METMNDSNIIYFNNDDEFFNFCVNPEIVINETTDANGNPGCYYTFNFTDVYNSCIRDGKKFIIMDDNSRIFKNKCVSYRTITKPVENLEPYFRVKI